MCDRTPENLKGPEFRSVDGHSSFERALGRGMLQDCRTVHPEKYGDHPEAASAGKQQIPLVQNSAEGQQPLPLMTPIGGAGGGEDSCSTPIQKSSKRLLTPLALCSPVAGKTSDETGVAWNENVFSAQRAQNENYSCGHPTPAPTIRTDHHSSFASAGTPGDSGQIAARIMQRQLAQQNTPVNVILPEHRVSNESTVTNNQVGGLGTPGDSGLAAARILERINQAENRTQQPDAMDC